MADAPTLAPMSREESARRLAELFRSFEQGINIAKDDPMRARARAALAKAFVFCKPAPTMGMAAELYIDLLKAAAGS
jgi:hypothetical protein